MKRLRAGSPWRCAAAWAALAFLPMLFGPVRAAETAAYPTRTIRLVVAFSAGGMSDTLARMMGERLEAAWGFPVVVENRTGASGNIASDLVARAAPDGHTLLVAGNGITILPSTLGARAVDPVRAFAPVIKLATQPILIAVNPALPVTSIAELVTLARAQPDRLAYATAGVGTTDHLAAALLWSQARVHALHIPYSNNAAEIKDLLSGEVKVAFITVGAVRQHLIAGQLKALAVTTSQRVAALPDVPTVAESGFPGFDVTSWYGVLAPAGTPAEIIDRLHVEIASMLQVPAFRDRIIALGAVPVVGSPEQFGSEIKALVDGWAPVVKAAGMSMP